MLSLQRGFVRLIIMNNPIPGGVTFDDWFADLLRAKPLITMVSEMPYLALEWFHKKIAALGFTESHQAFSVQKFKTPPKIARGIVIYETWGKTEAKVRNGSVDFGLEITQSGSAIRNYGLQISDEVMRSESGVWVKPGLRNDAAKAELARMFLLNLYGAIFAENKVLILFNVKKDHVPEVLTYLDENRLYADEPTMNEGANFTEFSVQMDLNRADLPIAKVRYDLAKIGATGIETVPLESCIPGIDAIDF